MSNKVQNEDDLNFYDNGRQPQYSWQMVEDLNFFLNDIRPQFVVAEATLETLLYVHLFVCLSVPNFSKVPGWHQVVVQWT